MKNLPFDKPGRFYKGNLHAHSDNSDGPLPPGELAGLYRGVNAYAHMREGAPDTFGGWVQVRSEALEAESILAALNAGHYYSSQGPEILAVEVGEGSVVVRCSPARGVLLAGRGTARARALGEDIVECELPLADFAGSYFGVTVMDAAGRRAWTNPIWLG